MDIRELNWVTQEIVDSCFQVHKELGPGLMESVYQKCLSIELKEREIEFLEQAKLPVFYKGEDIGLDFRMDFVVEESVIIEIKSIESIHPIHQAQIINYLKISNLPLGLLINFNVPIIKNGIKRYINNPKDK